MRVARLLVISLPIALCIATGSFSDVAERPSERVSPAPEVNPNAVVWRTPQPPANPQAGDVWIDARNGMAMVYVPAGEFLRGSADSDPKGLPDEKPQHSICTDAFWIGKHEVTVAQYRELCRGTDWGMPQKPARGWRDNEPVVGVSWLIADAVARANGLRLPTEAEWEKAARGTSGRIYPWGDRWDAGKCVSSGSHASGPGPVGSYPQGASPYGVMDMAGSVGEWCYDRYDEHYYGRAPSQNPRGPSGPGNRTLCAVRGSYWRGDAERCRSAVRVGLLGAFGFDFIGFRCVREPG